MKVQLRDVTVMLTPKVTYTLRQINEKCSFTLDGTGEFTPLEAKDVIAANIEMRAKLEDLHSGKLEPSLFWFEQKGNSDVELNIKDIRPQQISVWLGLDEDASSKFYFAARDSRRYPDLYWEEERLVVQLTQSQGRSQNRLRTFMELLELAKLN